MRYTFDPDTFQDCECSIEPCKSGELIDYSDYKKLEEENNRLETEHAATEKVVEAVKEWRKQNYPEGAVAKTLDGSTAMLIKALHEYEQSGEKE
jgi:hypothetical protein